MDGIMITSDLKTGKVISVEDVTLPDIPQENILEFWYSVYKEGVNQNAK